MASRKKAGAPAVTDIEKKSTTTKAPSPIRVTLPPELSFEISRVARADGALFTKKQMEAAIRSDVVGYVSEEWLGKVELRMYDLIADRMAKKRAEALDTHRADKRAELEEGEDGMDTAELEAEAAEGPEKLPPPAELTPEQAKAWEEGYEALEDVGAERKANPYRGNLGILWDEGRMAAIEDRDKKGAPAS